MAYKVLGIVLSCSNVFDGTIVFFNYFLINMNPAHTWNNVNFLLTPNVLVGATKSVWEISFQRTQLSQCLQKVKIKFYNR